MANPGSNSKLKKALNYVINRRDLLTTYLEDGRCSLSNNITENSVRPITVGRKNWLFSDTPEGATACRRFLSIFMDLKPACAWNAADILANHSIEHLNDADIKAVSYLFKRPFK